MKRVMLLVGTKKGGFVVRRNGDRGWQIQGPLCEKWPIHDMNWDPKDGAIYAGGGSEWYGPPVSRSTDMGETSTHSSEGLTYGEEIEKLKTVWNVTPADGPLCAGLDPAGMCGSEYGGRTWH